jgi:hypothetical protein
VSAFLVTDEDSVGDVAGVGNRQARIVRPATVAGLSESRYFDSRPFMRAPNTRGGAS